MADTGGPILTELAAPLTPPLRRAHRFVYAEDVEGGYWPRLIPVLRPGVRRIISRAAV